MKKTIAYIDGYNLYYGLLKGTKFKWLDMVALVKGMLRADHELVKVRYFTAPVRTYPHDMKSCVAYRSFEMLDGSGKRFAAVNSTWALMNIRELKPVKVSEEMLKAYDPLICPDFTPVSVKLKPEGTEEKVGAFKVTEAEIDTNGHMNNGAYARIADKFLPEDHKISSCAFQYKKMLFLDDEAQVFRAEKADGGLQIIFRKDGEICFMAEFGRTGICVLKK